MGYAGERSAARGGRGPQLVVNYLPVQFQGQVDGAGALAYESADQLQKLKDELRGTHVIVLSGKEIICVPLAAHAGQVGERRTVTSAGVDVHLQTKLLEERLSRILTEQWRYQLLRESPLKFVSRVEGRDLLEKALGRAVPGLHVYAEYSLDVRRHGPRGYPGVVVGMKTRQEIDLTVADLMRRGVQVEGLYVVAEKHSVRTWQFQDPHARRGLAGRVLKVSGDVLLVRGREGEMELDAAKVWIESSKANFQLAMRKTCGRSFERAQIALEEAVFGVTNAEHRIRDTARIADSLLKLGRLEIANGMTACLARPLRLRESQEQHVRTLSEPTFVFDQSGDQTDRFPDSGLTKFGPLDAEQFTPKAPHIAVVVPRQFQGRVETFVERFRNGVRGSRAYPQGFVRKFRLTDCTFSFTVFDGDVQDAAAYRRACLSALEGDKKINLALVFTSSEQEHLTGDDSPYLVTKSVFMGQGVPVQEYQVENIAVDDDNLAYRLSTMSLASYAKLGGTPFAVSDRGRPMTRELIFGIGSAHVVEDRMRRSERYVGITTVFNSDGRYLVSNVSREAPYEQYPQALLDALRTCITDVKSRLGWRAGDSIRLIFHVFKRLRDEEARAIKDFVAELTPEYASVDFAFVTVSEDHSWFLLDENGDGASGNRRTGRCVPRRGYSVPISKHERLVTVKGPRELKTARQGAPKPLLLTLHRESTFTDIDYLAGQIFRFTAMSWRRPYPIGRPVTISYSDLIAGLLGKLRHVTNWNSDMISTSLRSSRWFL